MFKPTLLYRMALSEQVIESLVEAESNLRDALAFAARNERPMICREIAKMISSIDTIQSADGILDALENRDQGSTGSYGSFFNPNDTED